MAVKRKIKLTQITGVAAGATASINLPKGVTYHSIHLQYTTNTVGGPTEANMVAEIGDIRININGVLQRVYAMQDLFNINRAKGITPTVGASYGFIDILFREPQRRTNAEREALSWGTLGIDTLQMEIDIIDNSSQTCTLKGWAVVDDTQKPAAGLVKVSRETIQVSATGDLTYNMGPGKGDAISSLYFIENTAGDINSLQINWDGVPLWDIDENVEPDLDKQTDYTVVSKVRHASLDYNDLSSIVPMTKKNGQKVGDFNAVLDMANAANVKLYRETVGRPN